MVKPITKTTNKTYSQDKEKEIDKDTKIEESVKDAKSAESKIEELEELNKEKDKKIDEMSSSLAYMQQQINMLMQQIITSKNVEQKSETNEEVLVCSRGIYDTVLCTNDNKILYNFKCNEEKYIDVEDLKTLFKESIRDNRLLFEEDTLYFKDPENYKRFNIKKRIDLSPENIVRVLTLPEHDMIEEVNKMTDSLHNFRLVHSLQFEIVKLLLGKDKLLRNWSYENRNALEKYIGQKFDDLMAAVGAIELLGRQSFKNL